MVFDAACEQGAPIYHTNLLMCVATKLALVGFGTFTNKVRAEQVSMRLMVSGRDVIDLINQQIEEIAGNAIIALALQHSCFSRPPWPEVHVDQSVASSLRSHLKDPRKTRESKPALASPSTFEPSATRGSTDMPTPKRCKPGWSASNRMRTGKRRTILVKFPEALSGGMTANSDPLAPEMLST